MSQSYFSFDDEFSIEGWYCTLEDENWFLVGEKNLRYYSDMWPSKAQPYLKNLIPDYLLFLIRGILHQLVNQLIIN